MAQSINSFDKHNAADDARSFSLWQQKQQEDANKEQLRRRKAELYALVRKVIKNELDPLQQEIVRLRWYEGKKLDEISDELQLDISTLSRKEKRINDILFDKLKYAMEYRFGKSFCEKTKEFIASNHIACCPVEEREISERLRNLRLRRDLTQKAVSDMTGIRRKRLELLEEDGEELKIDELTRLAGVYGVSTDYIIYGKSDS